VSAATTPLLREVPRNPEAARPGIADKICSLRGLPVLADTVEKVQSMPPARNNRINAATFLNLYCKFDAGFESMLLGSPSQNPFFNSIDPNRTSGRFARSVSEMSA
jgi:hypothetical protein